MILKVLFGKRKDDTYVDQYGPEALACMTEYDDEDNPDYLIEELDKAEKSGDFQSLKVIKLSVNERDIRRLLCPTQELAIPASVTER